ncbi:IS481 family transposase [Demequina lutea]|nr:IS481 family transposase [Demequina lutea]
MGNVERNHVIVLAVIEGAMSVTEAATRFKVSRRWIHTLLARYRTGGLGALDPQSRAPRSSPHATPPTLRTRVLELRTALQRDGLDAGAESIHDRLTREYPNPPSVSTIWRILKADGAVTPQPHKRPRSSWIRFESPAPNGCWQSDMTHWSLAGGVPVEIITWLDDHSRLVLHISAHTTVTVKVVTSTFLATAKLHGLPASTLTDNGMIFTTRFARGKGGPNHFEHVIAQHGIVQKNGHPGHPQTQGKIERFHQTLKRWLGARPPATTLIELTTQLAAFEHVYNHERAHRSLGRRTPAQAYAALPKTGPTLELLQRHWRVRHDTVDTAGAITLRWAGKLRHLGIGRTHNGHHVLLLVAGADTLVIRPDTGEIIAEHQLDPNRDYQPKKPQKPLPKEGPL